MRKHVTYLNVLYILTRPMACHNARTSCLDYMPRVTATVVKGDSSPNTAIHCYTYHRAQVDYGALATQSVCSNYSLLAQISLTWSVSGTTVESNCAASRYFGTCDNQSYTGFSHWTFFSIMSEWFICLVDKVFSTLRTNLVGCRSLTPTAEHMHEELRYKCTLNSNGIWNAHNALYNTYPQSPRLRMYASTSFATCHIVRNSCFKCAPCEPTMMVRGSSSPDIVVHYNTCYHAPMDYDIFVMRPFCVSDISFTQAPLTWNDLGQNADRICSMSRGYGTYINQSCAGPNLSTLLTRTSLPWNIFGTSVNNCYSSTQCFGICNNQPNVNFSHWTFFTNLFEWFTCLVNEVPGALSTDTMGYSDLTFTSEPTLHEALHHKFASNRSDTWSIRDFPRNANPLFPRLSMYALSCPAKCRTARRYTTLAQIPLTGHEHNVSVYLLTLSEAVIPNHITYHNVLHVLTRSMACHNARKSCLDYVPCVPPTVVKSGPRLNTAVHYYTFYSAQVYGTLATQSVCSNYALLTQAPLTWNASGTTAESNCPARCCFGTCNNQSYNGFSRWAFFSILSKWFTYLVDEVFSTLSTNLMGYNNLTPVDEQMHEELHYKSTSDPNEIWVTHDASNNTYPLFPRLRVYTSTKLAACHIVCSSYLKCTPCGPAVKVRSSFGPNTVVHYNTCYHALMDYDTSATRPFCVSDKPFTQAPPAWNDLGPNSNNRCLASCCFDTCSNQSCAGPNRSTLLARTSLPWDVFDTSVDNCCPPTQCSGTYINQSCVNFSHWDFFSNLSEWFTCLVDEVPDVLSIDTISYSDLTSTSEPALHEALHHKCVLNRSDTWNMHDFHNNANLLFPWLRMYVLTSLATCHTVQRCTTLVQIPLTRREQNFLANLSTLSGAVMPIHIIYHNVLYVLTSIMTCHNARTSCLGYIPCVPTTVVKGGSSIITAVHCNTCRRPPVDFDALDTQPVCSSYTLPTRTSITWNVSDTTVESSSPASRYFGTCDNHFYVDSSLWIFFSILSGWFTCLINVVFSTLSTDLVGYSSLTPAAEHMHEELHYKYTLDPDDIWFTHDALYNTYPLSPWLRMYASTSLAICHIVRSSRLNFAPCGSTMMVKNSSSPNTVVHYNTCCHAPVDYDTSATRHLYMNDISFTHAPLVWNDFDSIVNSWCPSSRCFDTSSNQSCTGPNRATLLKKSTSLETGFLWLPMFVRLYNQVEITWRLLNSLSYSRISERVRSVLSACCMTPIAQSPSWNNGKHSMLCHVRCDINPSWCTAWTRVRNYNITLPFTTQHVVSLAAKHWLDPSDTYLDFQHLSSEFIAKTYVGWRYKSNTFGVLLTLLEGCVLSLFPHQLPPLVLLDQAHVVDNTWYYTVTRDYESSIDKQSAYNDCNNISVLQRHGGHQRLCHLQGLIDTGVAWICAQFHPWNNTQPPPSRLGSYDPGKCRCVTWANIYSCNTVLALPCFTNHSWKAHPYIHSRGLHDICSLQLAENT